MHSDLNKCDLLYISLFFHNSSLLLNNSYLCLCCSPVCKWIGSRATRVSVPVWGHEPASATGHRSIWQQRSWIWLHHRSCVLQLDIRWLIGVDPVFLPLGTNYKESSKRKRDPCVPCVCALKEISRFLWDSDFTVCCLSGADGQMDTMRFVYREFL